MKTATNPTRSLADRVRGQAGMTLVEILLGLTISIMVMLPLSAWAVAVMRSQPISADSMMKTIRSGFIASYVPDDVASANAADDMAGATPPAGEEWWSNWSRSDCKGGAGSSGRKVMVLLVNDDSAEAAASSTSSTASTTTTAGGPFELAQKKIVYSIARSSADPSTFSVWRRTCNAIDKAPTVDSKELFEGVEPSISKSKAVCSSPAGELPCREVKLILTPKGAKKPVVMNVFRRTDAEAKLFIDDGTEVGNHVPAARIRQLSIAPIGTGQITRVVLDASQSNDRDGSIVNYLWRIPDAPVDAEPSYTEVGGPTDSTRTIDLPRAGTYSIELTVTDDKGASTTTYQRVVVENRKPVAVGQVSATSVTLGVDAFSLIGSGSSDPDGTVNAAASRWILSGTAASGSQGQIELAGLDHTGLVLGSEWAPGIVSISLVVVDNDGATDLYVTSLDLVAPIATTTTTSTTTTEAPPGESTTTVSTTSTTTPQDQNPGGGEP